MDFLKGSASSAIAYTFVYPIDVIKVQYQCAQPILNATGLSKRVNVVELVLNVLKVQGFKGFYKGYCANLLTYPIFWGVYFETNKHLKFNSVTNTFVAACIGSVISNPFFMLKVRCQTEILKGRKLNYKKLILEIYKNEGIGGFFKGYPMAAMSNIKLCIQMPLSKYLEIKIKDKDSNMPKCLEVGSGAAIAKISTSLITYPCDLIRNIQRDTESRLTMEKLIKQIYIKSGVPGFYRGLGLYTLVTLPNFVLMMMIKSKFEN